MQFRSSLKPYTIWINWVLANAHLCWHRFKQKVGLTFTCSSGFTSGRLPKMWQKRKDFWRSRNHRTLSFVWKVRLLTMHQRFVWVVHYKYQQDETIDFNNGFCITYMYIVLNFANTSYWTLTYSLFLNKSDS